MTWTDDQKKSIFAKPAQIVVSAAAGSGKTQVLTTRIIERIKDTSSPVSVDKLLIVTFTKAAASEMKERIGKALRNSVKQETDKEKRAFLKRQLALLGSAKICTIDSFCLDVIKQNFYKANLPSDISIGEPGELALLKLSALEDTVNALYCALEKSKGTKLNDEHLQMSSLAESFFSDADELSLVLKGFEALTNTCSYDKRDSDFSENTDGAGDYTTMIASLYNKAQSAAYPEKWLSDVADMYDCEKVRYEDTPAFKTSFASCRMAIRDTISQLKELAEISEASEIGYELTLYDDLESLNALLSCTTYDTIRNRFQTTETFKRLCRKKKECDPCLAETIKNSRTQLKHRVNSLLSAHLEFSLEECESLQRQLYPQIKALCSSALLLGNIYYNKMTDRKLLDFPTCEHTALKIISADGTHLTDVGQVLQEKYDEIYIDEIQDSNELQDILFSLISKGRCFLVGDVKQSIYGFRNADPSIFMKKCDEALFDEDAEKRKIFLARNFRSAKRVIDGVNSVFDVIMTSEVCDVDYKKEHRLDFGADFIPDDNPDEKCEIVIVNQNRNSAEQSYNEALYTANKISELIAEKKQVWDKDTGTQRAIEYRDIVILCRGMKSTSAIYETAFNSVGIPVYIDVGNYLYETNEVGQIIEILKLIDNAQNDISLACALRSPMFMFDENELLEIKLASNCGFCDAFYGICNGNYSVDAKLEKKCKNFLLQLKKWRNASGFVSVENLIRRVYNDTGIYSNVLSFPDGQMRRANLDLLLEKAEEFERSSYNGLFNFVNYVQSIKKTSDSISEAKSVSEKMNVVRIMTIHKSKGLEFPYVFLLGCSRNYLGVSTGAGGLIMNHHAGIGMNIINPLLRCKYKSPVQTAIMTIAEKSERTEEMRLLYVALTRAREKLYAVATLPDIDSFEILGKPLIKTLAPSDILDAKNYISLFALAYARGGKNFWDLSQYSPEEHSAEEDTPSVSDDIFKEDLDVSRMLDFKYEFINTINLPGKASVSLLKSFDINLAPAEDGKIPLLNTPSCKKVMLETPSFRKEKKNGAFYGSAHHKVLQYIDFGNPSVLSQCDKFLNDGILTQEEYSVLAIDKIEEFLNSKLGKMLSTANKIYREEAFVIAVPASEIDPSLPSDETICVQGVIDCYFEYEGKIILIDYKTDKYSDPKEIAEKYEKQLFYYEKALKSKCKDKVIQKYLYLMYKNDIIEL